MVFQKRIKKACGTYCGLNVSAQQVDSTGDFRLGLKDYFKNEFKVMLQTKSEKGMKKDYIIELDEYKSPAIHYKRAEIVQLADSVSIYVEENIARKQIEHNIKSANGVVELEEVKLTGYNLTPERQDMMDLHGPPDLVIENKELLNETPKWNSGLYSILQASYPDDIEIIDTEGLQFNFLQAKVFGLNFTFIVIDGVPVTLLDYPYIQSLPVEEIKSFELINNPKNANYYIDQVFKEPFREEETALIGVLSNLSESLKGGLDGVGVFEGRLIRDPKTAIISIYTYAGKGLNHVKKNSGISTNTVPGFTSKREFYAPKYNDEFENGWNVPDLRSVVHFEPNVNTDEQGNAQVEFYNADNIGEMLVVVEAMTPDGKMGYFETTYTVDNRLEK